MRTCELTYVVRHSHIIDAGVTNILTSINVPSVPCHNHLNIDMHYQKLHRRIQVTFSLINMVLDTHVAQTYLQTGFKPAEYKGGRVNILRL